MNNTTETQEKIKEQIIRRAENRIPFEVIGLMFNQCDGFIVAGNSLNREKPKDFDVFPINNKKVFCFEVIKDNIKSELLKKRCHFICETPNALTVQADDVIIQFCKYAKETPQKLIESFDFAHCQIAVEFENRGNDSTPIIHAVYFTDDWLIAKASDSTYYTGSEYPLSSLMRLVKYARRDMFSGNQYKYEMLKILLDIINRGFEDYEDFKDQMDSIDLGLLDDGGVGNIAYLLYEACCGKGLVRDY